MHQDDQGGAAGEDEKSSAAAHLLEVLRQFRLSHRGEYRHVLEQALSTYRLSSTQEERPSHPPSTASESLNTEDSAEEAAMSAALDELSDPPVAWPYISLAIVRPEISSFLPGSEH